MTAALAPRAACLLAALLGAATASADVDLPAAQARNLGVRSAAVAADSAVLTLPAVARVLDPLPLLRLDGEWRSAAAAARAAQAEAERARRLQRDGDGVSVRALQAAEAAQVAAQARLDVATAERRLAFGAELLARDAGELAQWLRQLGSGEAQLLRLEALDGGASAVAGARLGDDAGALRWIGAAPQASAGGALAYLALARDRRLVPGRVLPAQLLAADARQAGVRLADAAVLRWRGSDCVYVEAPDGHYARQTVRLLQRLDGGDWLAQGLDPGSRAVVDGAAAVLAADLAQDAPPPPVDED